MSSQPPVPRGPRVFFPRRFSGQSLPTSSPIRSVLAPSRRRRSNLSFLNFLLISYRSRNRDRIKRERSAGRPAVTEMHRYTDGMPSLIFRSSPPHPPPRRIQLRGPPLVLPRGARRGSSCPGIDAIGTRQKKRIFPQTAALLAPPSLTLRLPLFVLVSPSPW